MQSWHSYPIGESHRGCWEKLRDLQAACSLSQVSAPPRVHLKVKNNEQTDKAKTSFLLLFFFFGPCCSIPLPRSSYNLIIVARTVFISFDFFPTTLIWRSRCFVL